MLDNKVLHVLGETLQKERLQRHLSLRALSMQCGVPKSTIARYESGKDGSIESLDKICSSLGLVYSDLIQYCIDVVYNDQEAMKTEAINYYTDPRFHEMIHLFDQLTPAQQEAVLKLMRTLTE